VTVRSAKGRVTQPRLAGRRRSGTTLPSHPRCGPRRCRSKTRKPIDSAVGICACDRKPSASVRDPRALRATTTRAHHRIKKHALPRFAVLRRPHESAALLRVGGGKPGTGRGAKTGHQLTRGCAFSDQEHVGPNSRGSATSCRTRHDAADAPSRGEIQRSSHTKNSNWREQRSSQTAHHPVSPLSWLTGF